MKTRKSHYGQHSVTVNDIHLVDVPVFMLGVVLNDTWTVSPQILLLERGDENKCVLDGQG
jgi:hypothetical protein